MKYLALIEDGSGFQDELTVYAPCLKTARSRAEARALDLYGIDAVVLSIKEA